MLLMQEVRWRSVHKPSQNVHRVHCSIFIEILGTLCKYFLSTKLKKPPEVKMSPSVTPRYVNVPDFLRYFTLDCSPVFLCFRWLVLKKKHRLPILFYAVCRWSEVTQKNWTYLTPNTLPAAGLGPCSHCPPGKRCYCTHGAKLARVL